MKELFILIVFLFLNCRPLDTVRVTVYHIRGLTASGEHTDSIRTPFVAVSRDLLDKYPMHTNIKLIDCPYEGIYVVKDKTHKRLKNTVDIFSMDRSRKYDPCECLLDIHSFGETEEWKDSLHTQELIIKD